MSDWERDSGRDGLDKELAKPCPECGHALYKHREPGGKCDACVCIRKREPRYGCHDLRNEEPLIAWKDGHCWFWPLGGKVVPLSEGERRAYERGLSDGRATAASEQRDALAEVAERIGALEPNEKWSFGQRTFWLAGRDAALAVLRECSERTKHGRS